jgi:hypothetical protein
MDKARTPSKLLEVTVTARGVASWEWQLSRSDEVLVVGLETPGWQRILPVTTLYFSRLPTASGHDPQPVQGVLPCFVFAMACFESLTVGNPT